MPHAVAEFNGLENSAKYTGHALRRTSATWMADAGVDMINLKRFGGWKSDAAAIGYISDSTSNKTSLAVSLIGQSMGIHDNNDVSNSIHEIKATNASTINVTEYSNCTITFNVNK